MYLAYPDVYVKLVCPNDDERVIETRLKIVVSKS